MAATPGWQRALLKAINAPVTPGNIKFLNAWQRAEGGGARFNPLNTTQHWEGASNYNSMGVKHYPSFQAGIQATAKTLTNGYYDAIVNGLRSGKSTPMQLAQAEASTPWGTGAGIIKVLGGTVSSEAAPIPGGAPAAAPEAGTPGAPAPDLMQGAPDMAAQAAQQATQIRQAATQNLRDIATGTKPTEGLTQLASFIHTLKSTPVAPLAAAAAPAAAPAAEPVTPAAEPTQPGAWKKFVSVAAGADRAGVHTIPAVYNFAAKIARLYGSKLTIGTGTNHNQYVLGTHRESQHWTGHAADIPMSGDALTRLGQQALIAAGMPRAKALKQTGGVFNIGPYQILFNTMTGGNHYNHLHIGVD